MEELRLELERTAATAEERRRKDLNEVKRLAEGRERELRRTHAARLAEEKETTERRVAALKAQREADNRSWSERHSRELEQVRRDLEERLAAGEERHKSEIADLQERAEGLRTRRDSEYRLYGERLADLERGRAVEKGTAEKELEQRLANSEAERARLEDRIAEFQDALEEAGTLEAEAREALGASAASREAVRQDDGEAARIAVQDLERRLEEADAARLLAEERAADLETRLREATEENERRVGELEEALGELRKVSNPEQRIRSGISLFNASQHTRTVASISKSLGLPRVHVGADGGPQSSTSKPVITFVWEGMAWRRYVSDPTEGVEEPRVYLIGTGDDPQEINRPEPNARMDARGRLILGIQAF
jgi:chromosome segregation ATPase